MVVRNQAQERTEQEGLRLSVRHLRGVGERRAEALARLGVRSVEDLLFLFPRRYEDRRRLTSLDELVPDRFACVVADVFSLSLGEGAAPDSAILTDGRAMAKAVWFNTQVSKIIAPGMRLALYGRVENFHGLQLLNPEFEVLKGQEPQIINRIFPIYPATATLTQRNLRSLIDQTLETYADHLTDYLPEKIRNRHGMKGLKEALIELHHPTDEGTWVRARNRLAFDELFLLQTGLLLRRSRTHDVNAPGFGASISLTPGEKYRLFGQSLSFIPTRAQQRAIGEILEDIRAPVPMNRLLQGDVGSGKTLVALAAILAAVDSGVQAAFMVPTEILAQQHYMRIRGLLDPLGVAVGLLTGSARAEERRALLAGLQDGSVQILVCTHAIFSEDVSFARLGLTVVDEQHRFGVLQRSALIAKGPSPHVLVMTATPIPRTLTLSVYGDLDVSILDELPPGRKPVKTIRLRSKDQGELLRLIIERVRKKRQVYWVCPLIAESEETKPDLSSVTQRFDELSLLLPDVRMAMLHGRLPIDEKADVMGRFAEGKLDLLVATSVIEVGLDVANATMMVIEDAGQFGLAQLHQLRGRVGRGKDESLCALIQGEATTAEGSERIQAMLDTTDGFALAEIDLRQRGPGEVCGVRQHGVTDFRVADLLRDQKILALARRESEDMLREDPTLSAEPRLREELMRRLGETLHLAGTA